MSEMSPLLLQSLPAIVEIPVRLIPDGSTKSEAAPLCLRSVPIVPVHFCCVRTRNHIADQPHAAAGSEIIFGARTQHDFR
jgi:hypothetical protein